MSNYFYTVGTAAEAAFECDGYENEDEAIDALRDAYDEWKTEDGTPENEPLITVFRDNEPVRVIRADDISWDD
jgi:hypothetical protein